MREAKIQKTVNDVYGMVRDARREKSPKTSQGTESNTSVIQKHMINRLARKGWSKNEIVAEQQRIFGQDLLILPQNLDDTRVVKSSTVFGASVLAMAPLMFLLLRKRAVNVRAQPEVVQ